MKYGGLLAGMLLLVALQADAQQKNSVETEPVTVDSVDLNRYVGTWYEIARIPNSFQKKCAMNTTATYRLRPDGNIDVINRCVESDGSENIAQGIAKVVDPKTNAKLEVSFVRFLGIQLFWGDYWIIGLDREYRWAIVGNPSRKYGWILSRTPTLSAYGRQVVTDILLKQGYNPDDFVPTEQSGAQ